MASYTKASRELRNQLENHGWDMELIDQMDAAYADMLTKTAAKLASLPEPSTDKDGYAVDMRYDDWYRENIAPST